MEEQKKEFTIGITRQAGSDGIFEAGIDSIANTHNGKKCPSYPWDNRIVVFGDSEDEANKLRDRVLSALTHKEESDRRIDELMRQNSALAAEVERLNAQGYVHWPKKENETEDMRTGFERLYRVEQEYDSGTLSKDSKGRYCRLGKEADWAFYQRAWEDALTAVDKSSPGVPALLEALELAISELGAWAVAYQDEEGLYLTHLAIRRAKLAISTYRNQKGES